MKNTAQKKIENYERQKGCLIIIGLIVFFFLILIVCQPKIIISLVLLANFYVFAIHLIYEKKIQSTLIHHQINLKDRNQLCMEIKAECQLTCEYQPDFFLFYSRLNKQDMERLLQFFSVHGYRIIEVAGQKVYMESVHP